MLYLFKELIYVLEWIAFKTVMHNSFKCYHTCEMIPGSSTKTQTGNLRQKLKPDTPCQRQRRFLRAPVRRNSKKINSWQIQL